MPSEQHTLARTDRQPDEGDDEPFLDRNEVHLLGKVSGDPARRTLPSGDEIISLRVVVRRPTGGQDTVPVQLGPAPAAGSRRAAHHVGRRQLRQAERLEDGDRVAVAGVLRRRWWDAGGARRSRIEVAAHTVDPIAVGS